MGEGPGPEPPLRDIYRKMLVARRCDEEAVRLQRQGELVAFPPMSGQEAAQVASAMALRDTDMVFPSYRELGVAVARGLDLASYVVYYRGAWHSGLWDPRAQRFAPISSSVGSHLLHAVGWAMGARKDGGDELAITYFGDGATSEGDVSEAFNYAGVFGAPVIFLCQNNRWAISVPLERQTAGEIWRRAEGFGFEGVRVDGNDAEAVYRAVYRAASRARAGGGPTLVEAMTVRFAAHSTADDDTRYRSAEEREAVRRDDPIARLRSRLEAGRTEQAFFATAEEEARTAVAGLREGLRTMPDPAPEEMLECVYANPPSSVAAQLTELRGLLDLAHRDA